MSMNFKQIILSFLPLFPKSIKPFEGQSKRPADRLSRLWSRTTRWRDAGDDSGTQNFFPAKNNNTNGELLDMMCIPNFQQPHNLTRFILKR